MTASPLTLNVNERIIGGSAELPAVFKDGGFVLTDQRAIKVDKSGWSETGIHSVALEKIDATRATLKPRFFTTVFGVVMLVSGIMLGTMGAGLDTREATTIASILIVAGLIMVAYAFGTRRNIVEIISGSTTIVLNVSGMPIQQVHEMIAEIESAKSRRLEILHSTPRIAPPDHTPPPNTLPTGAAPIEARLAQLDKLRQGGLISQEEYDAKRSQIIQSL